MSTLRWEPYSMQPVRLPDFEKDIWWGLVTMFGTEGDVEVQHKQRTELAISNDGINWKYLKPGIPFLDNVPILKVTTMDVSISGNRF